jgi:formylglycine-generating enzyme required for sulfatase activity
VKIGTPGTTGAIELAEAPDGAWKITYTPTSQQYSARTGERITYRGRKDHAVHDWLRMPVSGVTSEDASAYVAWLDTTRRAPGARLCTEFEWERAARGADDREFPHSVKALHPNDANFDETYGQASVGMGPDEVGSRPLSRSPFGVDDMVGNIFEWVTSPLTENGFGVRGGSYFFNQMSSRSTNRTVWDASLRDARIGLRVCASLAQPR